LSVSSATPNRLILTVDLSDFTLTATGFDPHRDLIVDVRHLHSIAVDNTEPGADEVTESAP